MRKKNIKVEELSKFERDLLNSYKKFIKASPDLVDRYLEFIIKECFSLKDAKIAIKILDKEK